MTPGPCRELTIGTDNAAPEDCNASGEAVICKTRLTSLGPMICHLNNQKSEGPPS